MYYSIEIIIDLSRDRVIELFDSSDNLFKWQPNLISFDLIAGDSGQEGAKSRLKYKMGRRKIEMIETITLRNLPDRFEGTYVANGVWNKISNRFIEINSNQTKWISENEFEFYGFIKWLAFFIPGMFKKQSMKYLKQFKAFAEEESKSK